MRQTMLKIVLYTLPIIIDTSGNIFSCLDEEQKLLLLFKAGTISMALIRGVLVNFE